MYPLHQIMLRLAIITAAVTALFAPPIVDTPVTNPAPAAAHDGNNPHVPDAWFAERSALVFDKDADVGDQWEFNNTAQFYNERLYELFNEPDVRVGECENTQSPCFNVHKVNQPNEPWVRFNRPAGSINGDVWLNVANAPGDQAGSCWIIGRILGEHEFTGAPNASCLHAPLNLDGDFPQQAVLDEIHGAYGERRGIQL